MGRRGGVVGRWVALVREGMMRKRWIGLDCSLLATERGVWGALDEEREWPKHEGVNALAIASI